MLKNVAADQKIQCAFQCWVNASDIQLGLLVIVRIRVVEFLGQTDGICILIA